MNLEKGKESRWVASLNEVERSLGINDGVCMRDLFESAAFLVDGKFCLGVLISSLFGNFLKIVSKFVTFIERISSNLNI